MYQLQSKSSSELRQPYPWYCGIMVIWWLCLIRGGKVPSLEQIRRLTGCTIEGVSIEMLLEALDLLKFVAVGLECDVESLNLINAPFCALLELIYGDHFVLVVEITSETISFWDPGTGKKVTWQLTKFARHFSGYVVELPVLAPSGVPAIESELSPKTYLFDLANANGWGLSWILTLACLNFVFVLGGLFALKVFVATLANRIPDLQFLIGMVLFALNSCALDWCFKKFKIKICHHAFGLWRSLVVRIKTDPIVANRFSSKELIGKGQENTQSFVNQLDKVLESVFSAPVLLAVIGFAFFLNWILGLFAVAALVCSAIYAGKQTKNYSKKKQEANRLLATQKQNLFEMATNFDSKLANECLNDIEHYTAALNGLAVGSASEAVLGDLRAKLNGVFVLMAFSIAAMTDIQNGLQNLLVAFCLFSLFAIHSRKLITAWAGREELLFATRQLIDLNSPDNNFSSEDENE